jgi:hypothetical protein
VDKELLKDTNLLSLNKRHAVIVRLGEKRILSDTLEKVQQLLDAGGDKKGDGKGSKRKERGDSGSAQSMKKTKH